MTYTLYSSPGTASLAVHWMLIELGIPFELVLTDIETGAQKDPAYLALNPAGRVPTLMIEGRPHTEVAALLMLLAEREHRFDVKHDAPERADYLQRMVFLANTVQPAFRAWFYPDEPAGAANAEAVKAAARTVLEAAFTRIDTELGETRSYMLGERMTALDFLTTMLCRWSRGMPKPAADWPNLKRYLDGMRAIPSLQEVHAREGLEDWIGG